MPPSHAWPTATCARSTPTSPPRRDVMRRAASGYAKDETMGVIGKAALRLVTLLVLLALLVACSAPGRAKPTPTPGEEPTPSEMPSEEPSPDNPDQPAVTEVPPETPAEIPTAPPAA